ncbi:Quinolinate phosphoribosyltransferase [decarboxylating] [Chitinispirillum alkaliphilum]|nr:Quinolinate phosphoribosyltransferase [decarboxylating] [Chitinispirillum alkaliphilum]
MGVLDNEIFNSIVATALKEDLGARGDITSDSIFSDEDNAEAVVRSKSDGVISGIFLLEIILKQIGGGVKVVNPISDGEIIAPGTEICRLKGPVKKILLAERTLLNFLQHLSGISTATNKIASLISSTNTRLLDTRKTTPGLRMVEKLAVMHGGGLNHRFGLYDMILIKDTHIKRAGGIKAALEKALEYREKINGPKIEVEVQNVSGFSEALSLKPDRIMLDNMSIEDMQFCVNVRNEKDSEIELEASGNIDISTAEKIARTGVDYISSGAITHSAGSLDIHLLIL